MGKRKLIYFLLFILFPTYAAIISQKNNIIPPVTVKKPKIFASPSGSNKTIITREQIQTAGETSLAQALGELGGAQLQNIVGNNSQVVLSMRGFGANASSNILLLINGVPITNPDLAPPDLNAIPLSQIETIEIIAGSESVLYGDQAVGGAINIITRNVGEETAALSCNAGSYHQRNCYVAFNHHKLDFNITIGTNHTDNYREHNDYNQSLVYGSFTYPYATGQFNFNYRLANENMQYPGALTAAQVWQDRRQANNNTDFFKNTNGFIHLQQKQYLNTNWKLLIDFVARKMDGNGILFSDFTQARKSYFIKPQYKGNIAGNTITFGGDFQQDNYKLHSAYGLTNDDQQKYGLFGLVVIPIYGRYAFSIGARGAEQNSQLLTTETTNNTNRAFATTLGFMFNYTSETNFYLRRAGSFRFPKAEENASSSPPNGLQTQRGIAYETGIEKNTATYAEKIGIYQLNLRDEIAFDPLQTPENPFGINRNLAPTVRRGFTLSGKKIFNKTTVGGQYNYVNARFQSGATTGDRIPLVSESIIRGNIDYHFTDNWHFYTEAIFTGNQYAANDDANVGGLMGGYTIYNCNLGYQHKNLNVNFRINNLFNKAYYFYTVYQAGAPSEFFYPAPERNIMLTLNYLFT